MSILLTRRNIAGLAFSAAMLAGGVGCARAMVDGEPSARFRRGIGIHGAFNWPALAGPGGVSGSYVWPPFAGADTLLNDHNLQTLRRAGFDFIRLTVNPHIFIAAFGSSQYETAEAILAQHISAIHRSGLGVILDLHSISRDPEFAPDAVLDPGKPYGANVGQLVERMATLLARMPSNKVVLELWNEPNISAGREAAWDDVQYAWRQLARRAAPKLTLVIAGAHTTYDSIQKLAARRYNDGNTYFSFHFYDPVPFTHQGTVNPADPNDAPQYFSHVPYPANLDQSHAAVQAALGRLQARSGVSDADRAKLAAYLESRERYLNLRDNRDWIEAKFEEVEHWRVNNGIDSSMVMLGEFGTMKAGVDVKARIGWLNDVRQAAEKRSYCWAHWCFEGPNAFGLSTNTTDYALDQAMLQALGLNSITT